MLVNNIEPEANVQMSADVDTNLCATPSHSNGWLNENRGSLHNITSDNLKTGMNVVALVNRF